MLGAACWNGEAALHKPCAKDRQCGDGQSCIDGYCGGITGRTLAVAQVTETGFGNATSVVAAQLTGDGAIDLAVLAFGSGLFVRENTGSDFVPKGDPYYGGATDLVDLELADVDGDGDLEFIVLSLGGTVEVVERSNDVFTLSATLTFTPPIFSLATVDLVGDGRPDLVVAGTSAVHLVPNTGGSFDDGDVRTLSGPFTEPWDIVVVGEGPARRLLLPDSDRQSTNGATNQRVDILRVQGGALVEDKFLGTRFVNPFGIAVGDFLGDDALEVAVVERHLDASDANNDLATRKPGHVRFFRLDLDEVEELASIEIGVGGFSAATADLDADGKDDLVLGLTGAPQQGGTSQQVLFGSVAAQPRPQDLHTVAIPGPRGVEAGIHLAVADLDGDDRPEVVIPDYGRDEADGGARVIIVEANE
ncbi:MAG: FG-GAP-like repeat-containing protein [Nannocystaceae bacterium]|nr:FG-GAP-like repeat-containing protein [Nannocystaceae bacterium]